jgi:hypothetical protein
MTLHETGAKHGTRPELVAIHFGGDTLHRRKVPQDKALHFEKPYKVQSFVRLGAAGPPHALEKFYRYFP